MTLKRVAFTILLGLFAQHGLAGENEVSFGIGIGALYSGIGVNVGFLDGSDFKYAAAGCPAIGYSNEEGWKLPCGFGVGWIRTDIFSESSDRHGLGLYLGPVGVNEGNSWDDDKARYGLGVTYVYFPNGIGAKGFSVGFTPAVGKKDGQTQGSLFINAGYQF